MARFRCAIVGALVGCVAAAAAIAAPTGLGAPVVFVSRQILDAGSIYWSVPQGMPGVGPATRVAPAAPGRLLVLETDGSVRTLVDGAVPTAASLHLIDVDGPAVSYDAQWIAFAGLPQGSWDAGLAASPGGWRLYKIRADGTQLTQLTFSDADGLDLSQHGGAAGGLAGYDDFDPVWLPDGRIAFASTRWRSFAQYSGVRTSNLHVVGANGGGMQRITAERNGADRPLVDPVTGQIVFARWWRNHRFPIDAMDTLPTAVGPVYGYTGLAYLQHLGLTSDRGAAKGGESMFRNAWQAATIRPDGSGLAMWSGRRRDEEANHVYGGAFTPDGVLYANYFPMFNMTEAAGFGGIRRYERGAEPYHPIAGVTTLGGVYAHPSNPTSFGIYVGSYAAEPEVLPSGDLLVSIAPDVAQDYGLVRIAPDGGSPAPVLDYAGTSELRARVVAPRPLPPVLPAATATASALPPAEGGPYAIDGTFTFAALNVYANGPVDLDIVSAPPVGSANSIRFFLDAQRQSPGSFPHLDWPILLGEKPVEPDGSVVDAAPAWLPLFEQLRTAPGAGYEVPPTGVPGRDGAAHVTGMNYGPPGAIARCVGCHAGHTLIPVPASDADAQWSNLAPGATVSASSSRDANALRGLVDRRAHTGEIWRYWNSAPSEPQDHQWVALDLPVPVSVRTVRLWNPRSGDEAGSTVQVHAATVRLFATPASPLPVATAAATALSPHGTDVAFADVAARRIRVDLDDVSGTFYGMPLAALAEVEVIAKGLAIEAPEPGAAWLALAACGALAALRRR